MLELMIEAIVIILALGGLELVLWKLDQKAQQKQQETLDGILTELVIHNQNAPEKEEEPPKAR
jgi:hypothetical protein